MIDLEQLHECYITTSSKMVLLVVDGLGGLAHPDTRLSELETANSPGKRLWPDHSGAAGRSPG